MAQEAEATTGNSGEDEHGGGTFRELGANRQQATRGDEAQATNQAVDAIHQVHGVGDANDPDDRQDHIEGGRQEGHVNANAVHDQQARRQQLHNQPKRGRQLELIVDKPNHQQQRAAEQNRQELHLNTLEQGSFERKSQHERRDHAEENRQATKVRQEFLVQTPRIGFVAQAFFNGVTAHVRNKPPGHARRDQEDQGHRNQPLERSARNAERV